MRPVHQNYKREEKTWEEDTRLRFGKQGIQSVAITQQSLYTLTCQTSGNPVTQTAIVNVVPGFQEF